MFQEFLGVDLSSLYPLSGRLGLLGSAIDVRVEGFAGRRRSTDATSNGSGRTRRPEIIVVSIVVCHGEG